MDSAMDIGALRRLARCMAVDVGVFLETLAHFAIGFVISVAVDAMPDSIAEHGASPSPNERKKA